MKPRYTTEAIVMMLLGIAGFTLCAWALGWSSPLTKVWGAFYGFFAYVLWRIIVDASDSAMEEDGKDDLDPIQALLAYLLPLLVVAGAIVLFGVGLIALFGLSMKRRTARPVDF